MRVTPYHLLSLLLLCCAAPVQAQDLDADLAAANDLFKGQVRFKVDQKDRLIADFFDASGHYRQDVVYLEFLAPDAFAYNAEEQVVMLRCTDAHAQCIDKELFNLNTIRHSGRMNLPVPAGDPEGAKAIVLLMDLVRHAQAALTALDETKSGPARKN
jgi:hypothetical protein